MYLKSFPFGSKELWEDLLKICQISVFSISLYFLSPPPKKKHFFFWVCLRLECSLRLCHPWTFTPIPQLEAQFPCSVWNFGKFWSFYTSQWGYLLGIQSWPTEFRRSFPGQFWILKISESLERDLNHIESLWYTLITCIWLWKMTKN